jgi:TonB family protein
LLAGSICPVFSWQSAEKPEAKQQPQANPKPKDESSSQKPALEASKATGDVEILSDTMGFDFGPYLKRVFYTIEKDWHVIAPEIARPPVSKQGEVAIEFAILKDGKVAGLKMVSSSGDKSLDGAAWRSILDSNPFPQLPGGFKGEYLKLKFRFSYNPPKASPHPDPVTPAEKKPGA